MLLHRRVEEGEPYSSQVVLKAIVEGAVLRVRPKAMTAAVIIAGLLPIMWGSGTGSEVMQKNCRSDGGRHDHRPAALDVRHSGRVSPDAQVAGIIVMKGTAQ